MPLLKPTKKEIVRVAAEKARAEMLNRANDLYKEQQKLGEKVNQRRQELREEAAKDVLARFNPLVKSLNAALKKHGFEPCFEVKVSPSINRHVGVHLHCKNGLMSIKLDAEQGEIKDDEEITELLAQQKQVIDEQKRIHDAAYRIQPEDVTHCSVVNSLNGTATEALETLVKELKEAAVALPEDTQDPYRGSSYGRRRR